MPIQMLRQALRSPLPLLVALVLACAGSMFAQELALAPLPQPSTQEAEQEAVNLASLEPLPSAPEATTFSGGLPLPASPSPIAVVAPSPVVVQPQESTSHPFWDRENRVLFTAAGAMAAADFCTTRANLASGGRELNPVTRVLSGSTPGLAANFALETASTIAISYVFHKTGHHKLERMTSFVNIGSSAGAVAYGLTHR